MRKTEDFIRRVADSNLPLVRICFGRSVDSHRAPLNLRGAHDAQSCGSPVAQIGMTRVFSGADGI